MPYADPSKRIYDYTAISQWLLCQRRWYWYGIRNLVPDVPAAAPHFGQAIHAGIAEWFDGHDQDRALAKFLEAMQGSPPDLLRTPAKGELIIKGYAKQWPQEPFKVLENEAMFQVPMPDGSTYVGRRDRVIEWDGRILVMELKTTSGGIGAHYFKQFSPNLQIDGYCYAVAKKYGKCDGALVDAVQVCKTKEGYAREIHDRTPEDLKAFERRYMRIVADIEATGHMHQERLDPDEDPPTHAFTVEERVAHGKDLYLQNQMMCTYYGECPYRKLCLYNNEGLIEGHYKAREVGVIEEARDGPESV